MCIRDSLEGWGDEGIGLKEIDGTAESLAAELQSSPQAAKSHVLAALKQIEAVKAALDREALDNRRKQKRANGEFDAAAGLERLIAEYQQPVGRLVLVVDQMEEIFTFPTFDHEQRVAFLTLSLIHILPVGLGSHEKAARMIVEGDQADFMQSRYLPDKTALN